MGGLAHRFSRILAYARPDVVTERSKFYQDIVRLILRALRRVRDDACSDRLSLAPSGWGAYISLKISSQIRSACVLLEEACLSFLSLYR